MTARSAIKGFLFCLLSGLNARGAYASEDKVGDRGTEHTVIAGVGGATDIELGPASIHRGLSAFVEYEAIDNWLEFEMGVQVLAAEGGIEVPVDLLIKKPFSLTPRWELMVGVGPEVVRTFRGGKNGTYWGGELAFDFMFWPSRHVGLWVEPTYDLVFRDGVSRGLGCTGGGIVGW
jgi:hypothetical protein